MFLNKEDTEDIAQSAQLAGLLADNTDGAYLAGIRRNLKFNLFRQRRFQAEAEAAIQLVLYHSYETVELSCLMSELIGKSAVLAPQYQQSLFKYLYTDEKLSKQDYQNKKNALMFLKNMVANNSEMRVMG